MDDELKAIAHDVVSLTLRLADIYEANDEDGSSDSSKLTTISTILVDSIAVLRPLFNSLPRNNIQADIGSIYQMTTSTLRASITSSSTSHLINIIKCVILIHHIVYELISRPINHQQQFKGSDLMTAFDNSKHISPVYYTNVYANPKANVVYCALVLIYALESTFVKSMIVGMDLEFTNNEIKLCQMNFEHQYDNRSFIFIISPETLTSIETAIMTDWLFCNPFITKILHGGDAKDSDWIIGKVLVDYDKIALFIRNLVDTKMTCEYFKETNSCGEVTCKLYEAEPKRSVIYWFKLISTQQQDKLATVLGNISDPDWHITQLTSYQRSYAVYDVIFLKYFWYQMAYLGTNAARQYYQSNQSIDVAPYYDQACHPNKLKPSDDDVGVIFLQVLPQLTGLVYLEHKTLHMLKNHEPLHLISKRECNPINIYFVTSRKNQRYRLHQLHELATKEVIVHDPTLALDDIMKVRYFKRVLSDIIKRITYGLISQRYKINEKNDKPYHHTLHNNFIFDRLKLLNLDTVMMLFLKIQNQIDDNLKRILQ